MHAKRVSEVVWADKRTKAPNERCHRSPTYPKAMAPVFQSGSTTRVESEG